jgi:hypothetical protein
VTWQRGAVHIDELLAEGKLERVSGAAADGTALLAHQGLRTKASGHHIATEEVVRAQFGGPFGAFGALRRRRSEIEYPRHPADDVTNSEAAEAVASSRSLLDAADALLGELTIYGAT